MSGKRAATTELNHDNWNEENEPEDAGTFTLASNDILEKRVIKTARRRLPSKDVSIYFILYLDYICFFIVIVALIVSGKSHEKCIWHIYRFQNHFCDKYISIQFSS